jgi:hypothetical protein
VPGPPVQGGFQGGSMQGPPGQGGYRSVEVDEYGRSTSVNVDGQDTGLVARMSNALGMGRSSSPANQTYDWASKKVAAGVAAAGALVGGAMSAVGVSGQGEYEDHERWSEEAEQRDDREIKKGIRRRGTADEFFSGAVDVPRQSSLGRRKRRSVAVVVNAAEGGSDMDLGHHAVS